MPATSQSTVENRLLASLSKADFGLLEANLKWFDLTLRENLYEPNRKIGFAYFPVMGICSVVAENASGIRSETGLIGKEGFIGHSIVLSAGSAPTLVVVQAEGRALRIASKALQAAESASPVLLNTLLRFIHVFSVQVAQTAISNGHNTIPQRLARWMLMCQDRADAPEFTMTHEFLAVMLAVRRSGVTEALNELEGRKMIRSTRGHTVILDRAGLLSIAGGSYGVPEKEYQRLL